MSFDRARFDRGLYAEAWRVLRLVWPYALCVVLCDYALDFLRPSFREYLGSFSIFYRLAVAAAFWGLLAYMAHAEILLSDAGKRKVRVSRILGFSVRIIAVTVLTLVFFSVVPGPILVLLDLYGWIDLDTLYALRLPETFAVGTTTVLVALAAFGFLFPFILIGTLFPAYVADHRRGLGLAFGRGWRQFFWMAGRFLAGPWLVVMCSAGLYMVVADTFGPVAGAARPFGFDRLVMEATGLLSLIGWIFGTIMFAVLLSRAYLRDLAATGTPSPEEASFLAPEPPWQAAGGPGSLRRERKSVPSARADT